MLGKKLGDAAIAENSQFPQPFGAVHDIKVDRFRAMAAELGDSRCEIVQQPGQGLESYVFQQGLAACHLAVKRAAIPDARGKTQRNAERLR
jgi:hypothetical protein